MCNTRICSSFNLSYVFRISASRSRFFKFPNYNVDEFLRDEELYYKYFFKEYLKTLLKILGEKYSFFGNWICCPKSVFRFIRW